MVDDASPDGTADAGRPARRRARRHRGRATAPTSAASGRPTGTGCALAHRRAAPTSACRSTPTCPTTRRSCPPCSPTSSTAPTSPSAAATCPAGITENWPWRRRLLSRWGNRYAAGVLGLAVNDATPGTAPTAPRRSSGSDFDTVGADGYGFQIEMTHRLVRAGGQHRRVPDHVPRPHAPASRRCPTGSSARPPGWCSSCGPRTVAIAAGGGGSPADATPIDSRPVRSE